jgi:hypothetical protein
VGWRRRLARPERGGTRPAHLLRRVLVSLQRGGGIEWHEISQREKSLVVSSHTSPLSDEEPVIRGLKGPCPRMGQSSGNLSLL